MKFGMNSIVFFSLILATIFAWIGFEVYHKKSNKDLPPKLLQHTSSALPNSFDQETLRNFYLGKENFYEFKETNSNQ
jgi:hypothetical protein